MFPKYDKKQFANVVTGDETWVHYFEPVRKFSNKIWATKHSKRPIIAKRSLSTKKVLYAIFFSGEGVVGWCEGAVYLTSLGRPADIGLQLGKACYPCSG